MNKILSLIFIIENDVESCFKNLTEIDSLLSANINYITEYIAVINTSDQAMLASIKEYQQTYRNLRIISLFKHIDNEIALLGGIENALGDIIITVNLQTDTADFVQKAIVSIENGAEYVMGYPVNKDGKSIYPGMMLNTRFNGNVHFARAFSRRRAGLVGKLQKRIGLFHYLSHTYGINTNEISYITEKKITNLPSALVLWQRSISASFASSTKPLRYAANGALLASILSLLYVIYAVTVSVFQKNIVEGWLSTAFIQGIMFCFLFALLFVLSEYIIRISHSVRNEPDYIIAADFDSSHILTVAQKNVNIEK